MPRDMSVDLQLLSLDLRQLQDVAQTLEGRLREGLATDDREVKALPAFLAPPTPDLSGDALVIDAGGTNVRAALVRLGDDEEVRAGPVEASLPVRDDTQKLDAAGLWDLQADLASRIDATADLPLGYCFSYPSTVHSDGDATLLSWTKGVDVPGVEGLRVGAPLAAALGARGLGPSRTVVLNDTVAALLGGTSTAPDPERVIGLICGTGTNMASYFTPAVAPKLAAFGRGAMAVNLESGNFTPPHLTAADEAFDAESESPGRQRFEKAVSGYAMPHVFARLCPELNGFDPALGTGALVEICEQGAGRPQAAAAALLERSADLVAAGLYGVARVLGGEAPIRVLAEGTMFWKAPGYADRVAETLGRLVPHGPALSITRRQDVNLYGSAAAALSTR